LPCPFKINTKQYALAKPAVTFWQRSVLRWHLADPFKNFLNRVHCIFPCWQTLILYQGAKCSLSYGSSKDSCPWYIMKESFSKRKKKYLYPQHHSILLKVWKS
jgi:hypothetical protein